MSGPPKKRRRKPRKGHRSHPESRKQLEAVAGELIDAANRLRYLAHLTRNLEIANRLHATAQSMESVAKGIG